MKKIDYLRKAIIGSLLSGLLIAVSSLAISAQDPNKEYRQWQNAQARAERAHQDYMRTRRMSDYRRWQNEQMKAQREYADYQRVQSSYNNGYYNNGYYNNTNYGYNNRYRVYRNGSYYETDSRGAELLRQAVRNGYEQGYREGQSDKRYGRRYDYNVNTTYRNGNYGYQSYVASNQYQYYFQQGFQRGYEDGYRNTNRYGSGASILGSILNTIIRISNN